MPSKAGKKAAKRHVRQAAARLTCHADRCAVTLPFKLDEATTWKAFEALQRTKARWQWFVEAERLNAKNHTHLGTLIYLPLEIRDLIYGVVLDQILHDAARQLSRFTRDLGTGAKLEIQAPVNRKPVFRPCCSADALPTYCQNPDMPRISMYLPRTWPHTEVPLNLRKASRTFNTEFDNALLFNATFTVPCGHSLTGFLSHLSLEQQSYIQRLVVQIVLDISTCRFENRPWGAWVANDFIEWSEKAPLELPKTMNSLKFVGFDILGYSSGWREETSDREFVGYPIGKEDLENVIEFLKKSVKRWRKRAPNARVAWMKSRIFSDEDQAYLEAALDEMELEHVG